MNVMWGSLWYGYKVNEPFIREPGFFHSALLKEHKEDLEKMGLNLLIEWSDLDEEGFIGFVLMNEDTCASWKEIEKKIKLIDKLPMEEIIMSVVQNVSLKEPVRCSLWVSSGLSI